MYLTFNSALDLCGLPVLLAAAAKGGGCVIPQVCDPNGPRPEFRQWVSGGEVSATFRLGKPLNFVQVYGITPSGDVDKAATVSVLEQESRQNPTHDYARGGIGWRFVGDVSLQVWHSLLAR